MKLNPSADMIRSNVSSTCSYLCVRWPLVRMKLTTPTEMIRSKVFPLLTRRAEPRCMKLNASTEMISSSVKPTLPLTRALGLGIWHRILPLKWYGLTWRTSEATLPLHTSAELRYHKLNPSSEMIPSKVKNKLSQRYHFFTRVDEL